MNRVNEQYYNTVFTLTKTTMLQTTMNFRSARLTPQGKVFPNFVFNTSLRQDFFNKKLVVTLTTSDLFKTLKQKTELNTLFLKQIVISRRDAQIFYLGISYVLEQPQKSQRRNYSLTIACKNEDDRRSVDRW
ncbi:MAG: outer membrane beta-barrel protein [Chitinophagaceae bacterium]